MIEKVREYLQEIQNNIESEEMKRRKENKKEEKPVKSEPKKTEKEIQHGSVIQDRKSTFQGHVAQVYSLQDVK